MLGELSPDFELFIPKFRLKYDNLENVETDHVNTVIFNLHEINQLKFFWDTRYTVYTIHYTLYTIHYTLYTIKWLFEPITYGLK